MAKGIIISIGATGGSGGKLVITDFDPSKRASYKPGTEVDFTTQTPVKEGFLVDGTVSVDGHGVLLLTVSKILDSSPTVITSPTSGNITIGADQAYFVKSTGQISGSVSVDGGTLFVSGGKASGNISIGSNSTIIGNAQATISGGTFQITGSGTNACVSFRQCTINGKFSTNGITMVDLGGNNFNGNVESKSDKYVTITDNNINNNKDLIVSQVIDECQISGNTVTGSTTLDPKCQP